MPSTIAINLRTKRQALPYRHTNMDQYLTNCHRPMKINHTKQLYNFQRSLWHRDSSTASSYFILLRSILLYPFISLFLRLILSHSTVLLLSISTHFIPSYSFPLRSVLLCPISLFCSVPTYPKPTLSCLVVSCAILHSLLISYFLLSSIKYTDARKSSLPRRNTKLIQFL